MQHISDLVQQALSALPQMLKTILLRGTPAFFKWFAVTLFLINFRSWPLVWHYKVLFSPIFEVRARYYRLLLSTLFLPAQARLERKTKWLQSLCPVGEDPTKFVVSVDAWAGPDDCDFNWHLSNSSYPKTLDASRFRAALRICPTFFRAGGWMPLGATHFKFMKEIPIFAHYQIRMSIAAWDNKWLYVVTRYVTVPKKGKGRKVIKAPATAKTTREDKGTDGEIPSGDAARFPSLHTPATPSISGTSTPAVSANSSSIGLTTEQIAQLVPSEEPDGATVHCISVSELCFKIGRITVPPAVVLAAEGFSRLPPPPSSAPSPMQTPARYSLTNPPPSFARSQSLQLPDVSKGHLKTFQKFLKGGWKEVGEGERWWEDALGGEVEERRRVNLERVKGVRTGMEGALAAF
ncbi:hypothetical protein PHLCEN_2v7407 [Hermanssonia centrifuga]|uniref:Uncharacterized protein n=1 Tax=Hermanssonia centrifuga TaxID=98765 RepID=A0A2R6NWN3_9APHY|nr:hypothetical protein PHLCEN_2v7407 [Hermanssonia centrifuga]